MECKVCRDNPNRISVEIVPEMLVVDFDKGLGSNPADTEPGFECPVCGYSFTLAEYIEDQRENDYEKEIDDARESSHTA